MTAVPDRLARLVSWQSGRVALLGTRLTAAEMPLEARADFAVLACLEEHGPLSQAALGRILGFDRKNLHGFVHSLADRGLVSSTPDPADRRRVSLDLTDTGHAYFADLDERASRVQQELTAPLTPSELTELQRLLTRIIEANPTLGA